MLARYVAHPPYPVAPPAANSNGAAISRSGHASPCPTVTITNRMAAPGPISQIKTETIGKVLDLVSVVPPVPVLLTESVLLPLIAASYLLYWPCRISGAVAALLVEGP